MNEKKPLFSSTLVIRSAVVEDVDTLRDVFRRASLATEGAQAFFADHPEWLVWDDAMLPFARVAVVDGRVIGFASARPVDDFLELEDLFTDPDWMRKGIARSLIKDVERRGMRVEVTAGPHAVAFYKSVGFVVSGIANTQGGPAPRLQLDATCVRP
ncbi:GNAT family N-acetyltransferase [Paenibacillus daejeonensis]|uniref:GNAT family N-acetyltransferase n=1 Tax=Paenibacillus daejeonensis TaxID=135193 RepID=UPI0003716B2C|nr:GNAT family N-acetyltransferase [Paenibacillus daejeonensis]